MSNMWASKYQPVWYVLSLLLLIVALIIGVNTELPLWAFLVPLAVANVVMLVGLRPWVREESRQPAELDQDTNPPERP